MTYPVVVFDADLGLDPLAASGAGPDTPIAGVNARNHGGGSGGEGAIWGFYDEFPGPDLSSIPTDGSAVLAVDHPTRMFHQILGVKNVENWGVGDITVDSDLIENVEDVTNIEVGDGIRIENGSSPGVDIYTTVREITGSAPTYTIRVWTEFGDTIEADFAVPKQIRCAISVSQVYAATSFAIGGKLLTPTSGDAYRIGADASPGWTIQFDRPGSGVAYDLSETPLTLSASGDITTGPITLRGSGRPTFKATSYSAAFNLTGSKWRFDALDFSNCLAGILVNAAGVNDVIVKDLGVIGSAVQDVVRFAVAAAGGRFLITGCDLRGFTGKGINALGALASLDVEDTFLFSAGTGIYASEIVRFRVTDSIIRCGGLGIDLAQTTAPASLDIERNIFDRCGNGLRIAGAVEGCQGLIFRNNILSNCSGTALLLLDGAALAAFDVDFNCFWQNAQNRSGIQSGAHDIEQDPEFWDEDLYDYRVALNMRAKGFPDGARGASALTPIAQDIGPQRREPIGGGILIRIGLVLDVGDEYEIGGTLLGGNDDGRGRIVHVPKSMIPAAGEISEDCLRYQVAAALRDSAAAELLGKEAQV
jgi:hypothetical protein